MSVRFLRFQERKKNFVLGFLEDVFGGLRVEGDTSVGGDFRGTVKDEGLVDERVGE